MVAVMAEPASSLRVLLRTVWASEERWGAACGAASRSWRTARGAPEEREGVDFTSEAATTAERKHANDP